MKRFPSGDTLFGRNKRPRPITGRYNNSPVENVTPDRIYRPNSQNRSPHNYPDRREYGKTRSYKVLCVSDLHPEASDELIKDILYSEFKKFGCVLVKISHDVDEGRVAYVCFRSYEDAKEAKCNASRISIYDKFTVVEPVFESNPSRPRSRSITPDCGGRYKTRSLNHLMSEQFPVHSSQPYIPQGLLPPNFRRDIPPPHLPPPMIPPPFAPFPGCFPPLPQSPRFPPLQFGGFHLENREKRDKFPNCLYHIPPEEDPLATRTLFVGNLTNNVTFEDLEKVFERFGVIEDIDIKRPPLSNAFAFVRFQNLDMAHKAKVEVSGMKIIGDYQCKIGFGKAIPTEKIWVGGLSPMTSVRQLRKEFSKFGQIQEIDYFEGDSSAYIEYDSVDAARAAVKQMRGVQLDGQEHKLRLDFADIDAKTLASNRFPVNGIPPGTGGDFGCKPFGFFPSYESFQVPFQEMRSFTPDPCPPEVNPPSYSPKIKSVVSAPAPENRLSSAKTLKDVARSCPSKWQGALILKHSLFPIKFYLTVGPPDVLESFKDEGGKSVLRVKQRLRLDQPKLDDVSRKISSCNSLSIFLGLPRSSTNMTLDDVSVQTRPLKNLVAYLKHKAAAGVISKGSSVLYAFPPCSFSAELLKRAVPDLSEESLQSDHLVIVIVKSSDSQ